MTQRAKNKKRQPTGNVKFGAEVTAMREQLNISQTLLAAKCDVGRSLICLIESGERRPTADELYAMGIIFKRDMAELYRACSPDQAEAIEQRVRA